MKYIISSYEKIHVENYKNNSRLNENKKTEL